MRSPRLLLYALALTLAGASGLPGYALDMRGDTIYMILVDRFADGDPTNNTAVNPNQYSPDHSEWGKYFGGDLEGIRRKLDYLKTVGATAIWVTPCCQNDPYLLAGGTPYHGYDMNDFYRVEPHFGDWATFDAVANGLHARGMKLVLDVNLNNGGYTGSGNLCRVYKDGAVVAQYNRDYRNFYHHLGTMTDDKWNDPYWVLNANIFGMADLNQDQPPIPPYQGGAWWGVRRYLLSAVAKWVWHGVDAFRLDAAKHVPVWFVREFTDEMNRFAGWLGRPGAYAFAEYYGGGAWDPWSVEWSRQAGAALFDFEIASHIRNVELENESFWDLWNVIANRQTAYGTDGEGGPNSNWQVIWFDIHDWQRMMTVLMQKYGSETAARNRVDQCIVLVETLPGIPCIYYGTEQYLHNDSPGTGGIPGADPFNRPMMESWDTNTSAARTLSVLSALRKNNPALQFGDIQQRYVTSSIFVYSRQWSDSAVVVALNNSGVAQDIDVSGLPLPNGSYQDLLHTSTYVNVNNGGAHLHLEPTSSCVLVRGATGQRTTADNGAVMVENPDARGRAASTAGTCFDTVAGRDLLSTGGVSQSQDPCAGGSQISVDGRNIPSEFAGKLVATQDNFTWFGDAGHPGGGSELDRLFVTNDASSLVIGITGNLETNGNYWLVFLQTQPEGTNTLSATNGPPSGVMASMRGTMMDEEFAPNWCLCMNTSGGVLYVDLVDLVNNTCRFLGASAVNSGSGVLSGGVNPNGALAAFDNTNTAGVTSDAGRSIAQTATDAAMATTGAEISLPFADIRLSTCQVGVMVLLTGSTGYISDQSLPGFGGKFYNPGTPPIDFDRIPGAQYARVTLSGLQFAAQPSVAAAKALPYGSAVSLPASVVTGQYYPLWSYYIEDQQRVSGVRVRDTVTGYLPDKGQTVTVQGFVTYEGGEKIINAVATSFGGTGTIPKPLAMPNESVGGASIPGGIGLTNTGLLVTIWGCVTDRGTDESGLDYFYVDDGSGVWDGTYLPDGSRRLGVRVTISYVYPEIGSYVRVTGVSSVQMINGTPRRRVLPRSASDVRSL